MVEILRDDWWDYVPSSFRPDSANPKSPRCPLHLQRICGTCAQYPRELRPSRIGHNPAAIDTATCGQSGLQVHRLANAELRMLYALDVKRGPYVTVNALLAAQCLDRPCDS